MPPLLNVRTCTAKVGDFECKWHGRDLPFTIDAAALAPSTTLRASWSLVPCPLSLVPVLVPVIGLGVGLSPVSLFPLLDLAERRKKQKQATASQQPTANSQQPAKSPTLFLALTLVRLWFFLVTPTISSRRFAPPARSAADASHPSPSNAIDLISRGLCFCVSVSFSLQSAAGSRSRFFSYSPTSSLLAGSHTAAF